MPHTGLSAAEVAARLQKYGPNAFAQAKKVPGLAAVSEASTRT